MRRHLWVWSLLIAFVLSGGIGQAQGPRVTVVTPSKGTTAENQPTSRSIDANTTALDVNVASGGAGGGVAQTQVRDSGDTAWVNVGPAAGNAKMPATIYSSTGTELATSTNPLRVDPTGTTTQPVSGTVTANQGGTWTVQPGNTANTTAWLVTGTGGTFPISGNLTGNQATNTVQLGGTAISLNTGVRDTGTQRVTIATNDVVPASQSGTWTVQPGNTANTTAWKVDGSAVTQPVSGTVTANIGTSGSLALDATLSATQPRNITQFGGTAISTGAGAGGLGIPRVTVSNDSTVILGTGAATIGALSANQSINAAQFGGSAVVTGTGAGGAGIPRVTVSNDSSLAANQSVNQNQVGGVAVFAERCQREEKTYVTINQTAGTQLATGVAAERIYICSINVVSATAQNIAVVSGTGTVCATGIAGVIGGSTAATGWNLAANGGVVHGNGAAAVANTKVNADNLCLLQSGAGQVSGSLAYVSN